MRHLKRLSGQKLTRLVINIIDTYPHYSDFVMRAQYFAEKNCRFLACVRHNKVLVPQIFIREEIWDTLSPEALTVLLIHEIMHPTLKHPRCENLIDNIAQDLAINDNLVDMSALEKETGAKLMHYVDFKDARGNTFPAGLTWVKYRELLLASNHTAKKQKQGSTQQGQGNQTQQGQGQHGQGQQGQSQQGQNPQGQEPQRQEQQGQNQQGQNQQGQDQGEQNQEQQGQGQQSQDQQSQGQQSQGEQNQGEQSGLPGTEQVEITGPEGKHIANYAPASPPFRSAEAYRFVQDLANAMKRGCGTVPGRLQSIIQEWLQTRPEIPWNVELRKYVGNYARTRKISTWTKRARRIPGFVPGHRKKPLANGVVFLDASGSMSDKAYADSCVEMREMLKHSTLTVLVHDTELKQEIVLKKPEDMEMLKLRKGYGGTDFRPCFKWVDEQPKRPAYVVAFTDTQGPWPDEKPKYPVLLVYFRSKWARGKSQAPNWVKVIRVKDA